ncbi:hypothetical protein BGW42_001756 [Actinomortierella wolfii]|nr:hypothetical protein BGW42_001756 [Actinomortierella wolfii]
MNLYGRIENPIEINLMDDAPNFADITISYRAPPEPYPEPSHALRPTTDFPAVRVRTKSLRTLRVNDHAVLYFPPDSLHDLPSLNTLRILFSKTRADDYVMLANWDVPHPLRWTWDWYLPNLETLCLVTNLHTIEFSFRLLASCPCLRSVTINSISSNLFSLRTALLVENEMESTGGEYRYGVWVSTSVTSLSLRGSLDIPPLPPLPLHNADTGDDTSKQVIGTTNDIEYFRHPMVHLLTNVIPSLETLEFFPSGRDHLELIHEAVQMTLPTLHQHPSYFPNKLQRVFLPIPRMTSWNEEQKREFQVQYGFVNSYHHQFHRPSADSDELRGPVYIIER